MSLFLEYARSTELYKALCLSMDSPHGNLLERTSDETAEAQTEFLRWALAQCHTDAILETGTNKGLFGYFLSLIVFPSKWECDLTTCDINPMSATQVAILNRGQCRVRARFVEGDTRTTLANFHYPDYFDFAWIDGGHDYDTALSDLIKCNSLKIPFIAVDDTIDAHEPGETDVRRAVDEFCEHWMYELVPNPFAAHDSRGAVLLRRQD